MFFFNNLAFNHDVRQKLSNFFIGAGVVIYLFPTLLAFCLVAAGLVLASSRATQIVMKFFSRSMRR